MPVLLDEVIRALDPRPGQTCADCTAGLGGHSAAIAPRLAPEGRLILNDLDERNLTEAAARVGEAAGGAVEVETVCGNFAELPRRIAAMGARVDMVLADLGFASVHVDEAARGFSFSRDGPLDMRYGGSGMTAAEVLNALAEDELAEIIRDLGEERHWRRVASAIVRRRAERPFETTSELADVCRSAIPRGADGIDPATRTFQALRIHVNDELGSLDALLAAVERGARAAGGGQSVDESWLAPGARVGIISFHSLEDRLVKRAFRRLDELGLGEGGSRPISAGAAEVSSNPRARSAKLRVVRIGGCAV